MAGAREKKVRIVLYGPLGAGKTTCLESFRRLSTEARGKPRSFKPQAERTTRLDFIAPDVPLQDGMKTRIFLSTVSAWAYPHVDRRLLVKDADGIVFVADSLAARSAANIESLAELAENLRAHDKDPERLPMVLLFNKRDLAEIAPVDAMNAALKAALPGAARQHFEGVAPKRTGVADALNALIKALLKLPDPIVWESTGDGGIPFRAVVSGKRLYVKQGDAAAEPLYTLIVDGEPTESHAEWPSHWVLPRVRIGSAPPVAVVAVAEEPPPPPPKRTRTPKEPPLDAAGFERFVASSTESCAWTELERAYRRRLLRLRELTNEQLGHRAKEDVEYELWRALGLLYRDRFAKKEDAIEVFQMALRFRPSDYELHAFLAELHEELGRFDAVPAAYEAAIRLAPLRLELYQRLHRFYLRREQLDEARCVAAVLIGLAKRSEYEEERAFCRTYFPSAPLDPETSLDAEAWEVLRHEGETPALRKIFTVLAPVGLRVRLAELSARGEQPEPDVRFADARPRMLAGKRAAYTRPEHAFGFGFPAPTELAVLFWAATRIFRPEVELPAHLADRIVPMTDALRVELTGEEMLALRTAMTEWLFGGAKCDLLKWMQAADLTSLRAALVFAGDFSRVRSLMTLRDGKEVIDTVLFAIGARYLSLRKRLGLTTLLASDSPSLDAPDMDESLTRRTFMLTGTVKYSCGLPAGVVCVAAVAAGPVPILLGVGFAYNIFSLVFTREAFAPGTTGVEGVPNVYLVISVLNQAQDDLVPVLRYDIEASRIFDEPNLGTITVPVRKNDRPRAAPGLVRAPCADSARRHLRLDDEIIRQAASIVAPLVEEHTGWRGLLDGIRFEIVDDYAAPLRRRLEVVLGRTFDEREAEIIEHAGRSLEAIALWDPIHSVVYLSRVELEQQNLGFLFCTIGHELVHVGQTKNHPELEAQWRKESARLWSLFLVGKSPSKDVLESVFALMANIEGYADYIERTYLMAYFTCSLMMAREGVPQIEGPPPRRTHNELDVIEEPSAPPSMRTVLISQKSAQYDSGRRAYSKLATIGKTPRFDPRLRPEPIFPEAVLAPLQKKALAGDMRSQLALGDIYRTGSMVGVVADRTKAVRWYRLAAAGGSPAAAERLNELGAD